MSKPQESDDKEAQTEPQTEATETLKEHVIIQPDLVPEKQSTSDAVAGQVVPPEPKKIDEPEWVPGEQLELIRIPPPTIWPATLALGVTGMAFGVVTHWILSLAGLFLFLLGANGWVEDLKKDVL
jgi:hypothetical protein